MKQTTQYHLGALLLALTNLAQHLMGASGENENPNPVLPAEPTADKPKAGRPRKEAAPAVVTPPAETKAEALPVDDFADEKQTKLKPPFTWEQLKDIGRPIFLAARGAELQTVINKLLPADRQGQGLKALADFPDKHAEYVKNVEGLLL